jgi:predicted DNA-binding antitoxin AbrB/MazE fold protein
MEVIWEDGVEKMLEPKKEVGMADGEEVSLQWTPHVTQFSYYGNAVYM